MCAAMAAKAAEYESEMDLLRPSLLALAWALEDEEAGVGVGVGGMEGRACLPLAKEEAGFEDTMVATAADAASSAAF